MTINNIHNRIDYFDLMKGVCIVLVIISHCCVELNVDFFSEKVNEMLENLRMPLYFFLSGIFFKEYSSFIDFVVRKFNKLVIPMLFFCVLTVIPKLLMNEVPIELISIKKHITWMLKFGGYLWFLQALFIANISYYIYNKITKPFSLFLKIGVLLSFLSVGWILNSIVPIGEYRETHSYLAYIITSLIIMPFFFVATLLRKYLSEENIPCKLVLLVGGASLVMCYFASRGNVELRFAEIGNSILGFYVASFSAIAFCWSVCVIVKRMFYFSYVGRYSIIAYLTHYPIINIIVHYYPQINIYFLICIVLMLMPAMIYLFKNLLPAFVAQNDLIVLENRRIKVDWSAFSLKKS